MTTLHLLISNSLVIYEHYIRDLFCYPSKRSQIAIILNSVNLLCTQLYIFHSIVMKSEPNNLYLHCTISYYLNIELLEKN